MLLRIKGLESWGLRLGLQGAPNKGLLNHKGPRTKRYILPKILNRVYIQAKLYDLGTCFGFLAVASWLRVSGFRVFGASGLFGVLGLQTSDAIYLFVGRFHTPIKIEAMNPS